MNKVNYLVTVDAFSKSGANVEFDCVRSHAEIPLTKDDVLGFHYTRPGGNPYGFAHFLGEHAPQLNLELALRLLWSLRMKFLNFKKMSRLLFATLAVSWLPIAQGMQAPLSTPDLFQLSTIEVLGQTHHSFYQVLESYDEISGQSFFKNYFRFFLRKDEFQNIPQTLLARAIDIAVGEYLFSANAETCLKQVDKIDLAMGRPFPLTPKQYFHQILKAPADLPEPTEYRVMIFIRATEISTDPNLYEFSEPLDNYYERSLRNLPHLGISLSRSNLLNRSLKEEFWAGQILMSILANLGLSWKNENSLPWDFFYAREATRCVLGNANSEAHKGAGYVW